jgi:D-alanyl-D-alanine carboxypeptidase/D-alanyl-D-alanine-endopeptidase (penicillin-binding protein 4)
MGDRQRSQAPARAAVAALLALLGLPSCGGRTADAEARAEIPEGLHAVAPPAAQRPALARAFEAPPSLPERAPRELGQQFRARIAHWIGEAKKLSRGKATAANVRVALCVRELGAGTDLVAERADEPQPPASNMKLATTAAALILLGSGARWVTPLESAAPLADGALAGDLVVRAAGDPLLARPGAGSIAGRLDEVARALRAAGLARIRGDLVLDEGTFEVPGPGPGWPDPSQRWAEYCALAGGFSANGGVLEAHVRAGAVGARAGLSVEPSPHGLAESYDVRTTSGTKVDVRVGATARTATVRGTLGQGLGEYEAEFAHPDPVELFGSLLRAALARQGIELAGAIRRARGTTRGVVLAELDSPLADCLEAINSDSRNGVADQLFLSLGHAVTGQGTRAAGARAVELALERLGVSARGWRQVDGSGLSREDRATARALCALLESVLASDPGAARLYRDSLAVMGRKGTLAERLRGTAAEGRVFAKTGWIAGVSALSGYAEPEGLRPCVFSILISYPSELGGLNTGVFKKLQDELVLLLFQDGA